VTGDTSGAAIHSTGEGGWTLLIAWAAGVCGCYLYTVFVTLDLRTGKVTLAHHRGLSVFLSHRVSIIIPLVIMVPVSSAK
jgi:hypothetical protein